MRERDDAFVPWERRPQMVVVKPAAPDAVTRGLALAAFVLSLAAFLVASFS